MVDRSKYKKVTDLYIEGDVLELKGGDVLWMQVLNPFEVEEARNAAQVARARMVLALKTHGSDELAKLEARFASDGREQIIEQMVESTASEALIKAIEAIQNDPDWTEKGEILEREEELKARPETDPERKLLEDLNVEYIAEIERRMKDERDWQHRELDALDDEALLDRFKELWVERRGADRAMAEYQLTELFYAARACEATKNEDGTWDHAACENHRLQAWETREEVRALPEELQDAMADKMNELNMSIREGKGSGSVASSSDSSVLPSEQEASTPSTPDETPSDVPGTSASLSATP